ncbi:hypothetical protein [Gordonia sp. NPDC003585]|uniref:hypothetical protein n=1 Tax=Gordonia sp. NPDC003585 TaxID=3154275 RepID=UPI0033AD7BFC
MIEFGPQLIGQVEKTLGALLESVLRDSNISEREWVTLRIAAQNTNGPAGLSAVVSDRARFADAEQIIGGLAEKGLLDGDALTMRGREFLEQTGARISRLTAPIWGGLPTADVEAATRVLNEVLDRGRVVASSAESS